MTITEVKVKLNTDGDPRLLGYSTVTFDDVFVVKDIKIVCGPDGPFIAMPTKKGSAVCPTCRTRNHLRSRFCNQCGRRLEATTPGGEGEDPARLYFDVCHPIRADFRHLIEQSVLEVYQIECARQRRLP